MPQVIIRCPFHELELSNEEGFEPPTILHFGRRSDLGPSVRFWLPGDFANVQSAGSSRETESLEHRAGRRKAIARAGGVDQLPTVIVTEDDRVECSGTHVYPPITNSCLYHAHLGPGPPTAFPLRIGCPRSFDRIRRCSGKPRKWPLVEFLLRAKVSLLVVVLKGNAQNAHRSRLTVAVLTVRATPSLLFRANLSSSRKRLVQHFFAQLRSELFDLAQGL